MNICKYKRNNGDILVFSLVFMAIFLTLSAALLGVVNLNRKFTLQKVSKVNALEIAESGINYYQWHIAHNPNDYSDGNNGTGCSAIVPYACGPYNHDYNNQIGQKIGVFTLEITPPAAGSTIIYVKSTGWTDKYPDVKRIIQTRFGVPSLAEYSFLEDSAMIFSPTSETWGKVRSNFQIQFNGANHSTVESAEPVNGVWGAGGPQDLWHWPVPAIDFNKVTQDLSRLEDEAIAHGLHLAKTNKEGYHLILKIDNTADVYKVNRKYSNENIREQVFLQNSSLNNIHVIFVEDNLWLDGTVNNILTIASARFPDNPNTNTSIYISGNIVYSAKDKDHILGLIAQKEIKFIKNVPDNTIVEAHLLAQKGKVYRPCYSLLNSLTVYGGIISKNGGGFKCLIGDIIVSGYRDTYYRANPNAIYYPPPMFPITSTSTLISWEEVE